MTYGVAGFRANPEEPVQQDYASQASRRRVGTACRAEGTSLPAMQLDPYNQGDRRLTYTATQPKKQGGSLRGQTVKQNAVNSVLPETRANRANAVDEGNIRAVVLFRVCPSFR